MTTAVRPDDQGPSDRDPGDRGSGSHGSGSHGSADRRSDGQEAGGQEAGGQEAGGQGSEGKGPGDKGSKGEQTRQLILGTAVRLFGEQGYDKTTMRAIAQAAGVSVGNAYYYFPSKDHLVQEFYTTVQDAHDAATREALATPGPFADRLLLAMLGGMETMAPYHAFAGKFFRTAAEPGSPSSPFSAESAPARERSMRVFRSVVDGSTTKIDPELRGELPELLWLAQMGVTLYWVHDTSPGQARTRLLVQRAAPLIDRLVGMSRFRVFRPLVREVLELYRLLR